MIVNIIGINFFNPLYPFQLNRYPVFGQKSGYLAFFSPFSGIFYGKISFFSPFVEVEPGKKQPEHALEGRKRSLSHLVE